MFPILQIGPLSIQTPGLILITGIWLSLTLSEKIHHIGGVDFEQPYRIIAYMLLGAMLGGRMFYVLAYPSIFLNSPLSIFSPNPSLFDLWGALIGVIVAYLLMLRINRIPSRKYLDSISLFLVYTSFFVSLSSFAAGAEVGQPTTLPWGLMYLGQERHPTQIYEMIAFLILSFRSTKIFLSKNFFYENAHLFFNTIFWLACIKFVTSGFVINQPSILWGIRSYQLLYFAFSIGFLLLLQKYIYLTRTNG
jgi:phosphatidylglycerol:prolipoprotein diacylglycerol transferase